MRAARSGILGFGPGFVVCFTSTLNPDRTGQDMNVTNTPQTLPPAPAACECGRPIPPAAWTTGRRHLNCTACGTRFYTADYAPPSSTPAPTSPPAPVAAAPAPSAPVTPARTPKAAPTTAHALVTHANNVAAAGVAIIGYIFLPVTTGIEVSATALEAAVISAGLDPDNLSTTRATTALRRALESLRSGYLPTYLSEESAKGTTVYALRDKKTERDTNGKNIIPTVQKTTLEGATGALTFETPYREADIRAAVAKYTGTAKSDDVMSFLVASVKSVRGVSLRPAGGCYFLPEAHGDLAKRLHDLCYTLHGSALLVPVTDAPALQGNPGTVTIDPETKTATVVGQSGIAGALLSEIVAAGNDLDALLDPEKAKTVRATTWEKRAKDFRALREKAYSYRDLVSLDVADLETAIADLETKLAAHG